MRLAPWARPGLQAYLAVRLITLGVVLVRSVVGDQSLSAQLSRWDGRWFMLWAEGLPRHLPVVDGHVAQNPVAFFPLFGLLLRLGRTVLHLPLVLTGVTLTTLSGALAVWCVARLAFEVGGSEVARRTGILLALSPGAFVFSLIYAEGFFLTFSALALLAQRQQRWGRATLWASLATATSPLGLCLSVPAAVALWRQWCRRERPVALPLVAAPPLTFGSYLLFLALHTGRLNAWFLTERQGWHSAFSPTFTPHVVWVFLSNPFAPTLTQHLLLWGTVVGVALAIVLVRSGLPIELTSYGVASLVLSACSAPIGLRPRFLLCASPLLLGLSVTLPQRWWRPTWIVSSLLLAMMTVEELVSWAIFP